MVLTFQMDIKQKIIQSISLWTVKRWTLLSVEYIDSSLVPSKRRLHGSFVNLRKVTGDYFNFKLKNGLIDQETKTNNCKIKYKKNFSDVQYSRYGREEVKSKKI